MNYVLPSDVPGYYTEPVGGIWLTDASRSAATMDAEHRAGLHAADPCGDCSACEPSTRSERLLDPFAPHVERRLSGSVDPWLVAGEFRDLALGGEFHRVGGSQFDVALGRHAGMVTEDAGDEQINSVVGAR